MLIYQGSTNECIIMYKMTLEKQKLCYIQKQKNKTFVRQVIFLYTPPNPHGGSYPPTARLQNLHTIFLELGWKSLEITCGQQREHSLCTIKEIVPSLFLYTMHNKSQYICTHCTNFLYNGCITIFIVDTVTVKN